MTKECLWYDGETSSYLLLDFEPDDLTNKEIRDKAFEILKSDYSFADDEKDKALETLYLLDVDDLKRVKE